MPNAKSKPERRDAFADIGGAGGAAQFFAPRNPAGVEDLAEAKLIRVDLLESNPFQPRKTFDPEALKELAADIKAHGVLQPLLVRPHPDTRGRYQIVAGERRWRAAQSAGLTEAPCIERDMDDASMERLSLVENVQRSDLDPLDEARAYKRLIDRLGLSVRDVAASIHKDHSYIVQRLLLIKYPRVEALFRAGAIGLTVAVGIARLPDEAQREDLIARAEQGEHITGDNVRAARPPESSVPAPDMPSVGASSVHTSLDVRTDAPEALPAGEMTGDDRDAALGKFTHSEPEDARGVPLDAPTLEPSSAASYTAKMRQERTTVGGQAAERELIQAAVNTRAWPVWERVLEYGMESNMTIKTLMRLCREAQRDKDRETTS